jgi:hypothetical protein
MGFIISWVIHLLSITLTHWQYSTISCLHQLEFIVAHELEFIVSTSRLLATDLDPQTVTVSHSKYYTWIFFFTEALFIIRRELTLITPSIADCELVSYELVLNCTWTVCSFHLYPRGQLNIEHHLEQFICSLPWICAYNNCCIATDNPTSVGCRGCLLWNRWLAMAIPRLFVAADMGVIGALASNGHLLCFRYSGF